MKKKPELEADLDPRGTRHTRPGAKAAESALANSKSPVTRSRRTGVASGVRSGASSPMRPGAAAAARAVEATKAKRKRRK